MMNLRDKDTLYSGKPELGETTNTSPTTAPTSSTSRQWSGFKNPRIVRVSRTFGGKDRHSKVCTIKGLRDRRIRLSVPTAIQLYDLQDRLGLSQPSKVVDWLLDITKNDIDKLPPLPIVPGGFNPFHQGATNASSSTPFFDPNLLPSRHSQGININSSTQSVDADEEDDHSLVARLRYWESNAVMRSKQKGVDGIGDGTNSQVSAQNFFPIASGNTSILPSSSLMNNPMLNYYHWEPSNLSLAQLGSLGLPSQNDNNQGPHGNSDTPPSSLSLSSGSQLYLYPSMATTSLFPPHTSFMSNQQVENELRQYNNRFHLSNSIPSSLHNSSGLGLKPFPFSMNHPPEDKGDDAS